MCQRNITHGKPQTKGGRHPKKVHAIEEPEYDAKSEQ